MAKPKKSSTPAPGLATTPDQPKTASAITADPILGYKIRVLIYDLRNVSKDPDCERRTLQTTDELYISSPYFTPEEAAVVKLAISDITRDQTTDLEATSGAEGRQPSEAASTETVQSAIQGAMSNFFEKRKASGDARPCGPHDLAPIYESIFGIGQEETRDERFLSRLRRQGLPVAEKEDETEPNATGTRINAKKKNQRR